MEVIIIHGSKTYLNGSQWIRRLSYKIASCFSEEVPSFNYVYKFKNYLQRKGIKAEVFRWSGNIGLSDIKEASKRLNKILVKKKKVILFGKSNGGLISQFSAMKNEEKILKIVQVGTPNLSKNYAGNIPLVNIYSNSDKMQRNGIILYSALRFKRGSRKLFGEQVKNIVMNLNNHKDFNHKKIFDFYYKYIIS